MASFITVKRKQIVPICIAVFIFLIAILAIPIKYTPVKVIFPRYHTWHEISPAHLMNILFKSVPNGVAPFQCTNYREPGVNRSELYKLPIKLFSHTEVGEKINKLVKEGHPELLYFSPLMDKETKISLLHTYMVMADALTEAQIPFMALHGSLLGMYRFGSILPWDDDLDVGINVTHWAEAQEVLSCIRGFELFPDPVMRWSFFPSNGTSSLSMPDKKYPFVDIFFQHEDSTHVWGMQWVNRRRSVFPKKLLFPQSWGYLDGVRVPTPHNSLEILKLQYVNLNVCASQQNGHLLPPKDVRTIPCSLLYPVYGNFSIEH